MKRRDFIKLISLYGMGHLTFGCSFLGHRTCSNKACHDPFEQGSQDLAEVHTPNLGNFDQRLVDKLIDEDRLKSVYFAQSFPDDIYLTTEQLTLVKNLTIKFRKVQRHVGHGNFNLLGIDDFFHYAANISDCRPVSSTEKKYMEELFFFDAKKYGFMGEKTATNFTEKIQRSHVSKIPYSGHYLKKGDSLKLFEKVQKDVGPDLILTSGVRGVAKQFHLFLEKALITDGNLSKASRSLAPPGYSFHFRGDFDVGRKDYGLRNFEDAFAQTDEFKRLVDLGYVNIRYTQSNDLGVRFEPWHLKV